MRVNDKNVILCTLFKLSDVSCFRYAILTTNFRIIRYVGTCENLLSSILLSKCWLLHIF